MSLNYYKNLLQTVYVVFVKLTAYDGSQEMNPFNFEEIPLLQASLIVNGRYQSI